MEGRQRSEDDKGPPVQMLLKSKDPFELKLTDSRYPVGDWGLDEAGVFFAPLTWDRSDAHICSIFRDFKLTVCETEGTGGKKNPIAKARLEFPSSVSIEKRGHLQGLAKQCGLGSQSSGIRNERFLTVYTSASQAKKAKEALTKAKRLTSQQKREALDMWRCWKAVGGEGRKFSQKEVEEMMSTGQMDPELRDVYHQWLQAGRPALILPTARPQGAQRAPTTQELFDNIEWLKPESGQLGQVFYNKVHLSESGVEDSYWTPDAQGSTQLLSHLEVMLTEGLTHALVCTSVADYSYILNYFPPSLEVLSVVCPSDSNSNALAHKILVKCPRHLAEGTSTNPPSCDCIDRRLVEITHPKNSHKLHANFCVLRYEARVRLVVTSAPFSEQAWTRQGQLGWYCDLPVSSTEVMQQAGHWTADRHPLASDLEYLLYQLGVPQQTVWSVLTGTDFTGMSECVRLIPSVPGRVWPRGKDISRVGLVKLAELLSQVPWPAGHNPHMVYQSPHVDCSSSPWLQSLYCSLTGQAKGLFARRDGRKDQLLEVLNHIQVVHPWAVDVEDISNLPPSWQETSMLWEGDMWSNLYSSGGNVAWNAKTIMRSCQLSANKEDAQRYGWLLLGSHSMTPRCWGEVVTGQSGQRSSHDPCYWLHAWALSVLILPRLTHKQGVPKLLSPDLGRWDVPGKPEHLRRCPPGGLPVPALLKMSRQDEKTLYHLVGQVREVKRSGTSVVLKVPDETQTPSKFPLDVWPGPEEGYEAVLHYNVVLLSGLDHFPQKGWMVDMVACLRQNKDSPYLYVNGVLHTWEGEEQPGRHCNITDCHRHGPKHPQFTGMERHLHDFIVVGLDLDPKEPLHETYPDPKPPPGRDRLIGRLQRLNVGPYVPPSGPGSKHVYSLEVEAVWQRYFTGL